LQSPSDIKMMNEADLEHENGKKSKARSRRHRSRKAKKRQTDSGSDASSHSPEPKNQIVAPIIEPHSNRPTGYVQSVVKIKPTRPKKYGPEFSKTIYCQWYQQVQFAKW